MPSAATVHDTKRARLAENGFQDETIESKILSGAYSSFGALVEDLNNAKDAIIKDLSESTTNGDARSSSPSKPDIQDRLSNLVILIAALDTEASRGSESNTTNEEGEDLAKVSLPGYRPQHILSLRSQVNGSTQLLYSGLETRPPVDAPDVDGTPDAERVNLPNGFELTDFAALGGDGKKQTDEKRLFGTVFRPSSRLKALEPPRVSKNGVKGNTLQFIPYGSQIENNSPFKHDYRFAKLSTGAWLKYGGSGIPDEQNRKRTRQLSAANDFKAALEANDVQQRNNLDADALYSSVYSSFAPSCDNSAATFSDKDRSRQWWRKYGEQKLSRILPVQESEDLADDASRRGEVHLDKLEEVVAEFEPDQEDGYFPAQTEPEDVDDLLQQVSDMIETLSSYQTNRSLDPLVSGSAPKPSEPEVDVFEMLRTQLSIMVSILPPFAVAKLNGDQLEALNISTRLLVEPPDYPGTGQVNDSTLRRQKIQQATSASSRTTTTPQLRPNYAQAPVNTGAYSSQARNYNSVPATAGYGMRAPYQKPNVARPTYPQTSYPSSAAAYATRPTIQQFQRPLQNGYGNYGGTPAQAHTPGYVQRPGQPGYRPGPQDAMANVPRSASPQKPIINGHTYQPRQHPNQPAPGTPYPYQRQGSGTPGTPGAVPQVGTPYARYDASVGQPGVAGGGPGLAASQAPAQAPVQAPTPAQTVEVSR